MNTDMRTVHGGTRTVSDKGKTSLQKLLDPKCQVREKAERDAYRRAHAARTVRLADGERQVHAWAKRLGMPFSVRTDTSSIMRDTVVVTMKVIPGVILHVEVILGAMTEVATHLAFEGMEGSLHKHLGAHESIAEAVKAVNVLARAVMVLNLSDMRVLIGMMDDE